MKDDFKSNGKLLRVKWTHELRGKDDKKTNRRTVCKRLKREDATRFFDAIHG